MKGIKRTAIAALVFLMMFTLPAQGMKEQQEGEVLVKVLSAEVDPDGNHMISAQKENGESIIYVAGPDTVVEGYPIDSIGEGDYLLVRDNGIMTMSIPPQAPAASIRYVTPAVKNGLIAADFSAPLTLPGLIVQIAEVNRDDLDSAFSYSYGYMSINGLKSQGLYPHAGYFARGILDAAAFGEAEPLMTTDEMNEALTLFIDNYISQGVQTDYGTVYTTAEEINALEAPSTDEDRFAYGYGYFITLNLMMSGIEVKGPEFADGALSALYGASTTFTEEEMNGFITEYADKMQQEYQAYVAELSASNLAEAEAFLADNSTKEGVISLDSGVQVEFILDDDTSTAKPSADSNVVVDYKLTLLDGSVMDQGTDVEFNLQNLIPGFAEAAMQMTPGDSIRAYIPPAQGYGEMGAGNIEPNSLLIFDITLKEIKE